MAKELTAFYFEINEDGSRTLTDILVIGDGMSEKEFRAIADWYHPSIQPFYDFTDTNPAG